MNKKHNYITGNYFPANIRLLGILFIVIGLVLFTMDKYLLSSMFLFAVAVIFTATYGIELDQTKGTVHDYLSILGMRTGKHRPYEVLDKVYMTKSQKNIKMQLRAVSSDRRSYEFNGYIKFSESDKVHLMSAEHQEKVVGLLTQMSEDLGIPYEDHSND